MRYTHMIQDFFEEYADQEITLSGLEMEFPHLNQNQIRNALTRLREKDKRYETVKWGKSWRLNTVARARGGDLKRQPKLQENFHATTERQGQEIPDGAEKLAQFMGADVDLEPLHSFEFLGFTENGEPLLRRGTGEIYKAVRI